MRWTMGIDDDAGRNSEAVPRRHWRFYGRPLVRSSRSSMVRGNLAAKFFRIRCAAPVTNFALLLKKPVERMSFAMLGLADIRKILDRRVLREEQGRDFIDALVGALGR